MISVITRKTLIPLQQICMLVSQRLFQKNPHHVFFRSLTKFLRIDIKNNSWRIAQKILSEKVKQLLKRRGRGRVLIELQKKPKRTITKTLLQTFPRYLSQFCLNGVSTDMHQLLWLLRCGRVVGYKVEIPIPDPWILEEGEVLANGGCRVN